MKLHKSSGEGEGWWVATNSSQEIGQENILIGYDLFKWESMKMKFMFSGLVMRMI